MNSDLSIRRIGLLDTCVQPRRWEWAEANRGLIDACWHRAVAEKPRMFNGRVLMVGRYSAHDDRSEAAFFETDYAAFLAWGRSGFPDRSVGNGFALAALCSSDGAYLCGIMGEHTTNAGKIYFPGGTPDRNDVREDGTVDLAGSVVRELAEETGLSPADVTIADHWIEVRLWPMVAYLRPIRLALDAEAAVERLNANLRRQSEPELAGFKVVRSLDDVDASRMPAYLQAFFHHAFAAEF